MQKKCLQCGEKIIGRTDKKFCCDSCRNNYNNNLNKDATNLIRNTNNKLRKNYRILNTLNPDKKVTLPKTKLINYGFDFNLFTSIYTTKKGVMYFFVYDQGYLPLENEFYALVKRNT